ncbi:nickel-dependent lactate racemase [Planctomycetota bacterium]
MDILLPYGHQELTYHINDREIDIDCALPPDVPAIELMPALKQGFADPIGTPPLQEILKERSNITIVFSDRTRAYPAAEIIAALGEEIAAAGIPDDAVTLLCGAGAHAHNTLEICREIVGQVNAGRYNLVVHNAADESAMDFLGTTRYGTDIRVNPLVSQTDCLVLTGTIVPHYYAGFSGGRKGVVPGAAAESTIVRNHSLNFYGMAAGRNQAARTCNLEGNPVHADMLEGARMTGVDFIVNTTTRDDGTVTGIFCGELEQAHASGCRFFMEHYRHELAGEYDIVITSAGGAPKDGSLYQAHKAIDNAFKAVRSGGILVIAAECSEGFGKDEFLHWLQVWDKGEIEKRLRAKYQVEGHTAMCLRMKASEIRIMLVSELDSAEVRASGMEPFNRIEKAAATALLLSQRESGGDPRVLYIPCGSQFIM